MNAKQEKLRDKALYELIGIQNRAGDVESDHQQADAVLTELLEALGFEDVVREWDSIKKWYA